MYKCKICEQTFEKQSALAGHIGAKHKISVERYTILFFYNNQRPKCPECGEETRFLRGQYKFNKYCTKHANLARSEWSKNNKTFDYGWKKGLTKNDHKGIASQASKISGENNPSKRKDVREKIKENHVGFSGKNHSEETKSIIRKKGKENAARYWLGREFTEEHRKNLSENNARIWLGKELPEETRRKISETLRFHEYSKGENNPMFGKEHDINARQKMCILKEEFENKIAKSREKFEPLFNYEDFLKHTNVKHKFNVKCKKCGHEQKKNVWTLSYDWCACEKCKRTQPTSHEEKEVSDFVQSLGFKVQQNVRTVIPPQELDIYIPEKNFAFEYNGLYWHTTKYKAKKYHLEKTLACKEKNIQLFHIFSDEWDNKKEIVKSMIAHRLGVSKRRIYARKCEFKMVDSKTASKFFEETHIAGKSPSRAYFGLYFQNELVSCLALKKPIQKKHGNVLEFSRFSNALNTAVVGGFSKLFKKVKEYVQQEGFEGILTYADRRFGDGQVYDLQSEFEFVGSTSPGYFYTDGIQRHFRFRFRAQKPLTEKQVAAQAGVEPIYDCGHNIYVWKI